VLLISGLNLVDSPQLFVLFKHVTENKLFVGINLQDHALRARSFGQNEWNVHGWRRSKFNGMNALAGFAPNHEIGASSDLFFPEHLMAGHLIACWAVGSVVEGFFFLVPRFVIRHVLAPMLSAGPPVFEPSVTRVGARLHVGSPKSKGMTEEPTEQDRSAVLGFLLGKDDRQPRDEPLIAANIHEQLRHMGLSTWSISIHRRLRDALARQQPSSVLEIGAAIGHRSAWFLDLWERSQRSLTSYTLVEQGGKFGVILQRLLNRYEALSWASVVVGEPMQLAAEHQAWSLAAATNAEHARSPIESSYDAIVIDGPSNQRAQLVKTYLPFLSSNGVLYTVEPDMPSGDVAEDDEEGMALVNGFNAWIELVSETQSTHHVAFMPLFGGTLVAWMPQEP
jgi:predicted O-methyltransferase YrrM